MGHLERYIFAGTAFPAASSKYNINSVFSQIFSQFKFIKMQSNFSSVPTYKFSVPISNHFQSNGRIGCDDITGERKVLENGQSYTLQEGDKLAYWYPLYST